MTLADTEIRKSMVEAVGRTLNKAQSDSIPWERTPDGSAATLLFALAPTADDQSGLRPTLVYVSVAESQSDLRAIALRVSEGLDVNLPEGFLE
jgi:hypothetical protein